MNKQTPSVKLILFVVFISILLFSCVTMTNKFPSLFDANPSLLSKQYTPAEIKQIKKDFDTDPNQHAQAYGTLILWQMYNKSPEFALEFGQVPEIADGIDVKEAQAVESIYGLIEDLEIPEDLFEKKGAFSNQYRIFMEWKSNRAGKSNWGGYFEGVGSNPNYGKIINIRPIGFEDGKDSIDYEDLKDYGALDWKSESSNVDSDGFVMTFSFTTKKSLSFYINGTHVSFSKSELLQKKELRFNESIGLEGSLIVRCISGPTLGPELEAFRDLVLSGDGDHKFSAPLQALLWGYTDKKVKEIGNSLKNYKGLAEFVKPIWGKMEGPEWTYEKAVLSGRLGSNKEILLYHNTKKIRDQDYYSDMKTPRRVYESGRANCKDTSKFNRRALARAGNRTGKLLWVSHPGDSRGHIILSFKEKNKFYVMDKNGPAHILIGPFDNLKDIPYNILGESY